MGDTARPYRDEAERHLVEFERAMSYEAGVTRGVLYGLAMGLAPSVSVVIVWAFGLGS